MDSFAKILTEFVLDFKKEFADYKLNHSIINYIETKDDDSLNILFTHSKEKKITLQFQCTLVC